MIEDFLYGVFFGFFGGNLGLLVLAYIYREEIQRLVMKKAVERVQEKMLPDPDEVMGELAQGKSVDEVDPFDIGGGE